MKVLLIGRTRGDEQVVRELSVAGHLVERAEDYAVAMAMVSTLRPEVLLVCDGDLGLDLTELTRKFRTAGPPRGVVVVALRTPCAHARTFVRRLGADDVVHAPLRGLEIQGVMQRYQRPIARASESSLRRFRNPANLRDGGILQALHEVFRTVLSDCTMLEMKATSPAEAGPPDVRTGLAMVDVKSELMLAVEVVAPSASLAALVAQILEMHDADAMALQEFAAELCNNLLGGAKQHLRQMGMNFTLGVPASTPLLELPEDGGVTQQLRYQCDGVELSVNMTVRCAPVEEVAPEHLDEYMVLAEAAKAAGDTMVLPAGTRLTRESVARLRAAGLVRSVRVCQLGVAA